MAGERRTLREAVSRALTANLLGGPRRTPLPEPLVPVKLSLQLLLARRPGVFVAMDLLVFAMAFLAALSGDGGAHEAWPTIVIVPVFLVGAVLLSDVVAVDRRAGSLDLSLSSPGARHVYERRLLCGVVPLLAQAWIVVVVAWLAFLRTFALVPALVQSALLCALVGAATLFWAVRLKTAGAVMLATLATLLLLGKWTLRAPMPVLPVPGLLLPPLAESGDWLAAAAVLSAASVLLYLHARRRLDRPELLLG